MNKEKMGEKWEYTIRMTQPVILACLAAAAFGGVTIWLYLSRHPAWFFSGIFTVAGLLMLLLFFHQLWTSTVYMGREGFFYRSQLGVGKYFRYGEVRRAWVDNSISWDRRRARVDSFCNFITYDGERGGFQYFSSSAAGVNYFMQQVQAAGEDGEGFPAESPGERRPRDPWDCQIDSCRHPFGRIAALVGSFTGTAAFGAMAAYRLRGHNLMGGILTDCLAALCLVLCILCLVRLTGARVYVGGEGFYRRGRYYPYDQIRRYGEEVKSCRQKGKEDFCACLFVFTDNKGKRRKFRFYKPENTAAVSLLEARLEQMG